VVDRSSAGLADSECAVPDASVETGVLRHAARLHAARPDLDVDELAMIPADGDADAEAILELARDGVTMQPRKGP
jgi:hypothetical protein